MSAKAKHPVITPPALERGQIGVSYTVEMPKPSTHNFEITVDLSRLKREYIELRIPSWTPGSYTRAFDPVGPQAVQYACNHGALRIDLWGVEGGERGQDGLPASVAHALSVQYHRVVIQACVDACPDILFVQHGEPLFRLKGKNAVAA